MEAVDFLVRQHRAMEAAMERFGQARQVQRRKSLFDQVADHLMTHIESEEWIFYPAVKNRRTEDILLESLEEHLSLKRLLADLLQMKVDDRRFGPKFKVLQEQAEHHHKEEEEHLFPKVRKLFDPDEREKLGQQMQALQVELRKEGEPRNAAPAETGRAASL